MTRQGRVTGPALMAGAPAWLTCAGLLLIFAVPAQLLDSLGFGYATQGGNALGKIHPGTDLVLLGFAIAAARVGNPLRFVAALARRFPGAATLGAATVLLMIYLVRVQQAPFTALFDTFLLPVLLLPMLVDMPPQQRRVLAMGLHVFMAVNATLGVVEFLTDWRLIPARLDGVAVTPEMDWRASGLMGHPLVSAMTAGQYCVIIAMGFGAALSPRLRVPAVLLQFMSLTAFGGRTAMVITMGALIAILAVKGVGLLRGHRFSPRAAALTLILGGALALGAVLLAATGYFDQLLARFAEDNGSAKSRAIIFDIFSHFSWQELWFGPDQAHVASVLHLEGIEVGVESFWLGFVVLCGLWMSGLFFIAFGAFLLDVTRRVDWRALLPLGFYVAVISTTVSLSVKSASLAHFMTLVLVLMPRRAVRSTRPAALSFGRSWRPA